MLKPRQPVETVCHNELFPWNTVFRSDVPVAFIDWDTAAPGHLWPGSENTGLL
jgi:Ser/Thr protein kinase RdoA (MazF antagonist)